MVAFKWYSQGQEGNMTSPRSSCSWGGEKKKNQEAPVFKGAWVLTIQLAERLNKYEELGQKLRGKETGVASSEISVWTFVKILPNKIYRVFFFHFVRKISDTIFFSPTRSIEKSSFSLQNSVLKLKTHSSQDLCLSQATWRFVTEVMGTIFELSRPWVWTFAAQYYKIKFIDIKEHAHIL